MTLYPRPPVSTDLAIRDRPRDRNLPQSTAIYGNLPHSAIFCQVRRILFYPVYALTKGLFGNFFWPGQIGQVDIHQVSFFTSVRQILSANSRRQSRGVYPPGEGRPFGDPGGFWAGGWSWQPKVEPLSGQVESSRQPRLYGQE